MRGSAKLAALVVAALLVLQGSALADEAKESVGERFAHGSAVAFDLLFVRTCGLAAVAIGTGLFVPAAFMSAAGGRDNLDHAIATFINAPVQEVYKRPLGEF